MHIDEALEAVVDTVLALLAASKISWTRRPPTMSAILSSTNARM